MKTTYFLLVVLSLMLLTGCAQTSTPTKYAELRLSKESRIQVLIRSKRWMGLVNPEDGIAAHNSYSTYCWSTLDSTKSEYVNPAFNITSTVQHKHRGTIKVDRKGKSVVIALERLVSKPGEPERWEASPHNGTYQIKEINHEPFQKPE
jgi:hypothetical protein